MRENSNSSKSQKLLKFTSDKNKKRKIKRREKMEVLKRGGIISKIKGTGMFRFLSNEEFEGLDKFINILSFNEGEVIIKEGERAGGLFMILEGKVKVIKDNIELSTLVKEEFFGEGDILMSSPASASAIAASSPTEIIYIIKGGIDILEKQNPKIAMLIYKYFAKTIFARLVAIDREYVRIYSEIQNKEIREKLESIREKVSRSRL